VNKANDEVGEHSQVTWIHYQYTIMAFM